MTNKKNDNELKYDPNVTKRDIEKLGERHSGIRKDGGDDQQLQEREKAVDFEGKDLDIPETDRPKRNDVTLKDEENKLYSQGGDNKNNLERDDAAK